MPFVVAGGKVHGIEVTEGLVVVVILGLVVIDYVSLVVVIGTGAVAIIRRRWGGDNNRLCRPSLGYPWPLIRCFIVGQVGYNCGRLSLLLLLMLITGRRFVPGWRYCCEETERAKEVRLLK